MPVIDSLRRLLLPALLAALPALAGAESPPPLPALNIDIHQTSVSGISSGGFLAVQFQVAHSSIVKGGGIVAAGPYYCAEDDAVTAMTRCSCTGEMLFLNCAVSPTSADVPALVQATRRFAAAGLIDDPANIAGQRLITFAGGKDGTVPAPVVAQLAGYFTALGLPAANVSANTLADAGHTMPTNAFGNPCPVTDEPYLGACGYDAAGALLAWIYGPLQAPGKATAKGRLLRFDQRPYIPAQSGFAAISALDDSGWLYVPPACAKGKRCRLHIALHGCKQGQSYTLLRPPAGSDGRYGTTFVEHAGYNAWADANDLVILYPQAVSVFARNPFGCWDWWGYTGEHYADRQGVQIRALRAMVDRLTSKFH